MFLLTGLALTDFHKPIADFKEPYSKVAINPARFEISANNANIERIDDITVQLTNNSGRLVIPLADGEAIYGLTERICDSWQDSENSPKQIGGLDRRGEIVTMWVMPTISAYAAFYISSAGYGMFVQGADPGVYDIGKTEKDELRVMWDTSGKPFSCVFIKGSYTEILDKYTELTGRPFLPPKWAFLPLKWRDQVARGKFADLDGLEINAEVADDILRYEQYGFPVGMYMIDRPWAQGKMGYGNFNWDPHRFPNGDKMVEVLHKRGWRVIVWGAPWAIGNQPHEFGPEARAKGLIIGGRTLDYTNPAAVQWHKDKISAYVKRSNIDGWKLDRSEEYNPSSKKDIWHDGRTGFEVHNDYPRLYIKTFHDATKAIRGNDFFVMPRASYTGSQAHSIVWGGDTRGSLEYGLFKRSTDLGLRSVIISLQRMAFMGFPVWGSDTGGYQTFRDREVFARWLQVSCFCPLMEVGGIDSHEPWNMPTKPSYDQQMLEIMKKYLWIHTRLADYTYELAKQANRTGNPIVHPLVFDWPDDPQVKDMWDQYMYGPALLVAPIWETGKREREVYLPQGTWIDLWDKSKQYTGPLTITEKAPLDKIPVFIKAGKEHMLPGNLLD